MNNSKNNEKLKSRIKKKFKHFQFFKIKQFNKFNSINPENTFPKKITKKIIIMKYISTKSFICNIIYYRTSMNKFK